jgi:hypothetical protein
VKATNPCEEVDEGELRFRHESSLDVDCDAIGYADVHNHTDRRSPKSRHIVYCP